MFQAPNYTETVSMKLSEVLADIGVDESNTLKRRRHFLLMESLFKIHSDKSCAFLLGSQSEGTTTVGLHSDLDIVVCDHNFLAIQDWSDWLPGVHNLLMIQNNSVPPGYCLLQVLRSDVPLPNCYAPGQHTFKDRRGRVFLKNSVPQLMADNRDIRHGPANSVEGVPGFVDKDHVFSIHCKTWPQQAKQWLYQDGEDQWPYAEMKQYCKKTGCLLVCVGCRGSENEQLEWRISTSLAERCLMFNLNITQIRCYVLMKMILKTFINPSFKDVISSYMCKTVLFHCITKTHANSWRENNLLSCLSKCLSLLCQNIRDENCPHFIIPGNNLMRGKISPEVKPLILKKLNNIINNAGGALLEVQCDDLGSRVQLKFCNFCPFKLSSHLSATLCATLQYYCVALTSDITATCKSPKEAVQALKHYISKVLHYKYEGLDQIACRLLVRWSSVTLGSILASNNIRQYNPVSTDALTLVSLGQKTDVASSKLKLASILYCTQDIQQAEIVLRETERDYNIHIVEPMCFSNTSICVYVEEGFATVCDIHEEEAVQYITATSVRFLPYEILCVPKELRQEMFRSTQEDRMLRKREDEWMDLAVVDPLPYLYFLQYKVYSNLGKNDEKQSALSKLLITINEELALRHRETALNLLAKCYEQEDRVEEALQCYLKSLDVRRRNNAAKIHIATLLSALVNARVQKAE